MKSLLAVVFAAALATLAGCAAESTSDTSGTASSDMIVSAVKLDGAYRAQPGTAMGGASFEGIVFNADNTFFADVDTGVRCITAPCPQATARLVGTYQIAGHSVVLSPDAALETNKWYGRYNVTIGNDGSVTLSHTAVPGVEAAALENTLTPQASFCSAAVDCGSQDLIHPMCAPGGWTCGATNACAFKCGK